MRSLVFVSGWAGFPGLFPGLDAEFLLPFILHSEDDIASAVADAASPRTILVGWSTGAHILLKRCTPSFADFGRVLLLAPFAGFTDHVPQADLTALDQGLARAPGTVLRSFLRRCGVPGAFAGTALDGLAPETVVALRAGLDYLAASRAEPEALPANTTLVHGRADRIVPAQAAADLAARCGARLTLTDRGHYFDTDTINGFCAQG